MLDPIKAHGQDGSSMRLLKLPATLVSKPLQIIYKNCFYNECLEGKQLKKNYQPVLLQPISGKKN